MSSLAADVRFALRQFARAPGFTLVAILTLGIGIGANSALATMADALLARPLPGIHDADRLAWIVPFDRREGHERYLSYPDFVDYRDMDGVFEEIAAMTSAQFSVALGSEPDMVRGEYVSASFFSVLGVRMALGRGFTEAEDRLSGGERAVVISHRLWRERFDPNQSPMGARIVVNGMPHAIVGVAPERFNGADHDERRDLWVPLAHAVGSPHISPAAFTDRNAWWLSAVGRLRSGVDLERASAAVATVARRIELVDSTGHGGVTGRAVTAGNGLGGRVPRDIVPIAALAGGVTLLILLIACANVANLLLSRGVTRRREVAVRLSLGGSRWQVVRQLLTESAMLAVAAAGAGLLMSAWATDLLASFVPVPLDTSAGMKVVVFTIVVAAVTTFAFGLLPALHATRTGTAALLKEATVGVDVPRARLQGGFVVAQLALSTVLLVLAGMFIAGLRKANDVPLFFDATDAVLTASFNPTLQRYETARADALLDELATRVGALSGVRSVSFGAPTPMADRLEGGMLIAATRGSDSTRLETLLTRVRPRFFATLGVQLLRGRDFTADDRRGSEAVAIVSADLARTLWGSADPLDRTVVVEGAGRVRVVGVAGEALTMGPYEQRRGIVYLPLRQSRMVEVSLLARVEGDARPLVPHVRRIMRELDPALPVYAVQTLRQARESRGAEHRLGSILLGIMGTISLLLATVGVYGVMAFAVRQRVREIGVRMALGATARDVSALFIRRGTRLGMIGAAAGLLLGVGVARLMASLFFGVQVADSFVFAAVALLLVTIVLLASWIPARRAARVDPIIALRAE